MHTTFANKIRYTNNILRCHSLFAKPLPRATIPAKVYWGPTGTGKTHRSWLEAGEEAYIKSSSNKWWDGYRGQTRVIIDEFDGQIGITHLLRWMDKYPCSVEVKGGTLPLMATDFWITSNKPIEQWYPDASGNQVEALKRRVVIEHITLQYIGV
jgi:hypothetical protein